MTYGTTSYGVAPYGTPGITPDRYDPVYNIRYSNTRILRSTPPELVPTILVTEMPTGGSSSTEAVILNDINITRNTVATSINNYNLNIVRSSYDQTYDLVNATPSICTLDNSGNVAHITNGTSRIIIYTPYHILNYLRILVDSSTTITYTWNSWTPGSLGAHINSEIRAMIVGKTPGAATQSVLSSTSGGVQLPNHIRNANLFTGSLDLSAISIYNSSYNSNIFPVVLISPRHVMAGHVGANPGSQFIFKTPGGSYEIRTVISQSIVPEPTSGVNYVGYLDSEITSITPMKLLPSTWEQYLPCLIQDQVFLNFPVLNKGWTEGDFIRILNLNKVYTFTEGYPKITYLQGPALDVDIAPWSSSVISGDSNGPVFIPINGQPVLLHCMNYSSGGDFYSDDLTGIQSAMTSLGSGTLTYADLSAFPTY